LQVQIHKDWLAQALNRLQQDQIRLRRASTGAGQAAQALNSWRHAQCAPGEGLDASIRSPESSPQSCQGSKQVAQDLRRKRRSDTEYAGPDKVSTANDAAAASCYEGGFQIIVGDKMQVEARRGVQAGVLRRNFKLSLVFVAI
jgi:hypothetical protein